MMLSILILAMVPAGTLLLARHSLAVAQSGTPAVATESDLKAAYLVNILKFVHRKVPASSSAIGTGTGLENITLCLLAAQKTEPSLRALEGRIISGRKLKLHPLQKADRLEGCQAIFVGRTSGYQAILERARIQGILTVGNDSAFVPASGMVSLLVEAGRIVVEVNGDAVKSADWVFSSHLLEIARIIHPGSAAWNQ